MQQNQKKFKNDFNYTLRFLGFGGENKRGQLYHSHKWDDFPWTCL